mmetsp:Transcript_72469/g.183121  ORF Transcript_72469/g.183121 Transcript_72469/m.183121 type:complete len:114 (-) Transcript_72469:24-365(-)
MRSAVKSGTLRLSKWYGTNPAKLIDRLIVSLSGLRLMKGFSKGRRRDSPRTILSSSAGSRLQPMSREERARWAAPQAQWGLLGGEEAGALRELPRNPMGWVERTGRKFEKSSP